MNEFQVFAPFHWVFVVEITESLTNFGGIEPISILFFFVGAHGSVDNFSEGILFLLSSVIQKG